VAAREIHVATTGDDSNPGNTSRPYRTINKAAQVARPGDTVVVHGGTYREWVRPARGGRSENERIVYRAAPGEEVVIKGSERVTSWVEEGAGVWKIELPNSFFGHYNPYAINISGGWLKYGGWHHCGDVYLDGGAFLEKQTLDEVRKQPRTWHCRAGKKMSTIWANFGKANPNERLAEINVRQCIFFPEKPGLSYITVEGFHLMHSAENWQNPALDLQVGAIGPRMGRAWIIQDCRITNARCAGIVLGIAPGVKRDDLEAFGHHIVRRNIIRRCGQAGIVGLRGAARSLIADNLIEDINYRGEFGGYETAGIKFHLTVDTTISGNLIRRVRGDRFAGFGIWIDWANQGIRITRNFVANQGNFNIFLEMNHGPSLVDNNVVVGKGIRSNSEATIFAHNLFVGCRFAMVSDTRRASQFYRPHTAHVVGRKHGIPRDDRWFNNIFIRTGLGQLKKAPGYAADYNVFLAGAAKSTFGDEHSLVDPAPVDLALEHEDFGARLTFTLHQDLTRMKAPWVNPELLGLFPTAGQTIEDALGRPITVDTDFDGRKRRRAIPGPFADPRPGRITAAIAIPAKRR